MHKGEGFEDRRRGACHELDQAGSGAAGRRSQAPRDGDPGELWRWDRRGIMLRLAEDGKKALCEGLESTIGTTRLCEAVL